MDLGLTDRAFVVTAASTGLGRATAQQLVAEGARVVLVARRAELLAEAVSRLDRIAPLHWRPISPMPIPLTQHAPLLWMPSAGSMVH
jgi:NAD(P)-dependent dehydrogenase (short-subunit alcohol dehydrogenase family)